MLVASFSLSSLSKLHNVAVYEYMSRCEDEFVSVTFIRHLVVWIENNV